MSNQDNHNGPPPGGPPGTDTIPDNPNQHISTMGMITTLLINIGVFVLVQWIFEVNRFYKQIYLKRLQKRFEEIGRVPPIPPHHVFGWLKALYDVSEMDVLRMVGLDAYMLLRYHVVCWKLSLFMSFWGIVALTPIYSTATNNIFETGSLQWDHYTLRNVVNGASETKYRLWAAAVFGYIFAAYFMQLLYAEYNNFSVRRLQYLVQANPDSPQGDPDTPPQKYFTIMVENIPGHLRSAAALYKFFEKLFPGEVFNVEIALDLSELNALTAERQSVRDKLEKAIAAYEATNVRPQVYLQTGNVSLFPDGSQAMASESNTYVSWLQQYWAPEMYGYELVDSISYHTLQLQDLNRKVDEMQHVSFEYARNADKDLVRKLRNKSDTRAAAMVETLKTSANIFTDQITGDISSQRQRGNQAGGGGASSSGGGGQSPRKKKKRKTSLTPAGSNPNPTAAAAAAASAAARTGPGNGGGRAGPSASNGAASGSKKAPFWETFLFGAQAPEFNDVVKAQMRKIALDAPPSGKSGDSSSRSNSDHGEIRATTHNPLLALAATTGPPPKQLPQLQLQPLSPRRSGSGNGLQQADDEVKLTVKASSTGGFKLQMVDDDDDEDEEDYSDDDDSDDGRPAHPPGHLVRTMSEATRPENFDLLLTAGQARASPWAPALGAAKLKTAAAATNLASGLKQQQTQQQQPLPRPADVAVVAAAAVSSSTSSLLKQSRPMPLAAAPPPATQKQQQPLAEPQRQQALNVLPKASQFVPFLDAATAGADSGLEHGTADVAGTGVHSDTAATAAASADVSGYVDLGGSGRSHASEEEEELTDPDHDHEEEEGQEKDNLLFHLEEDATLREWMKTAQVDVQQELELAERRAEQLAVDARSAKYLTSSHGHAAFPAFGKLKDINDLLGQDHDGGSSARGGGGPAHRKASFSLSASMADALASVAGTVTSAIHSSSGGHAGVTPPVSGSPPDKDKSLGQDKDKGQEISSSGRMVRFHDDDDGEDGDDVDAATDLAQAQSSSSAHEDDDDKACDLLTGSSPPSSSHGPEGGTHHDHPPSPSRPVADATGRASHDEEEVIDDGSGGGREPPSAGVFQSLGVGLGLGKKKTKTADFSSGASSSGGNYFNPDLGPGQGQCLEQGNRDFFGDIGLSQEQMETANKHANKIAKVGWEQTKIAGSGALRGIIEVERAFEMLTLGAYYKYSSTAFVTFNSRITESIAQQMLLSHDAMEVNHAPNPNDIIWDNVSIPRSQIRMRNFITNTGIIVGSLFWSSLVTSINDLAATADLPQYQQQYLSVLIVLVCLLVLPFIFDFLARYYEGIKLESEIQSTIMTRYFWYQLINVYVTVGFGGVQIVTQILMILKNPQLLVNFVGQTIPSVSLYFVDMVIVKIFTAVPLEMIRPWQIITIHLISRCMDRRKTTRRDLRTGAFYAWPMLYGWIYPQLLMVTMIMVTYACIAPLLMPFCALFFAFAYLMYKYQLLYVYINDYQSGGDMWYATFGRSLISLIFAALTLLGYLSLELQTTYLAGPFYFLFPLPFCIVYFWYYCEAKFKKPSMNLSFGFAKELDHRNNERKAAGKPIPHESFRKDLYRQPSLTQQEVYPEPYRRDSSYEHLRQSASEEDLEAAAAAAAAAADDDEALLRSNQQQAGMPHHHHHHRRPRGSRGTMSINVHEELDQGEDCQAVLKAYFEEVVLPLAREVSLPESLLRRRHSLSEQQSNNDNNHATDAAPTVVTRQRS